MIRECEPAWKIVESAIGKEVAVGTMEDYTTTGRLVAADDLSYVVDCGGKICIFPKGAVVLAFWENPEPDGRGEP